MLAQATRKALAGDDSSGVMRSQRAVAAIDELRGEFHWLRQNPGTALVQDADGTTWWWTFAGTAANIELAGKLGELAPVTPASGLAVRLADHTSHADVAERLRSDAGVPPAPPAEFADAYKFAGLLPEDAAVAMFEARERDPRVVKATAAKALHRVRLAGRGPRP